jgi:hypothetical protein
LERYGEGATLIRKEWKPRAEVSADVKVDASDDSDDEDEPHSDHGSADDAETGPEVAKTVPPTTTPGPVPQTSPPTEDLDDLASTMKSLSLVPTSIRFGRGARRAGFVRAGAVRGGISNVTPQSSSLRKREKSV